MKRARLLLADDHALLIDGLRKLLEPDFELVGAVCDGRAAVEAYDQLRPDLTLMDVGLPLLNGIEAARQIKRTFPEARILFVTMQTDRVFVEEAFRAGGKGYVLKQAASRELVDAIHSVLEGRFYLSPQIAEKQGFSLPLLANPAGDLSGGPLTLRQREVLQLVAEGKAMKEIGQILEISVRTVEFHKTAIMEKLGIRTTAELTRYALDQGITARHTLN